MTDKFEELQARSKAAAGDLWSDVGGPNVAEKSFIESVSKKIEEIATGYMVEGIIQGIQHCIKIAAEKAILNSSQVFTREQQGRQAAYRQLAEEFRSRAHALERKLAGTVDEKLSEA